MRSLFIMDGQLQKDLTAEKEVAYFSALVSAFVESSMELDRSILTLSAGGIGLLITLLTTIGASSLYIIVLYAIACFLFFMVIILILTVLRKNKPVMVKLAKGQEVQADEAKLKIFDLIAYGLFMAAVLVSFIIGMSTALNQLSQKENRFMSKDENTTQRVTESLQGLSNMNPKTEVMKKSLEGLSQLKPTPSSTIESPPSKPEGNQGGTATPGAGPSKSD